MMNWSQLSGEFSRRWFSRSFPDHWPRQIKTTRPKSQTHQSPDPTWWVSAPLQHLNQMRRIYGFQFKRTRDAEHILPIPSYNILPDLISGQFIQNPIIRARVHFPKSCAVNNSKSGLNWYPRSPNKPIIISLYSAVSVIISRGFKTVCCSNIPSNRYNESRIVLGITIPWNIVF